MKGRAREKPIREKGSSERIDGKEGCERGKETRSERESERERKRTREKERLIVREGK